MSAHLAEIGGHDMYKVIKNGTEKMCSAEETEAMIKDFNKRNHIFSIDEMWRAQKVIYLNDPAQTEKDSQG